MAKIGDFIKFVDEKGFEHNALIQWVHGEIENPTINLIHLSGDDSKKDSYGRQSEKRTSISHKSRTTANGLYWTEA
jgi:hypothetical protein